MNDPAPAPEVEVRPAATVMLVRDAEAAGGSRLEVLMLRRHLDSVFAAGAWVFPGGAVDAVDGDHLPEEVGVVGAGPTDAEASALLEVPSGGLSFWVAAARECFEEAGILLARDASGEWADTSGAVDAARFERHRRDVHAGRRTLAEVLAAEGLVLDLSNLHYVSHWITPRGGVRRFDTRFFLAPAPAGQAALHDTRETVESAWMAPAQALARHAAGEIHLVYPTIKSLQALARYGSVEETLVAARSIGRVPVIAPRVLRDQGLSRSASSSSSEPSCPT